LSRLLRQSVNKRKCFRVVPNETWEVLWKRRRQDAPLGYGYDYQSSVESGFVAILPGFPGPHLGGCETAPHFCFVHYSTAGRVTFGFMKKYIWISLIAVMSIACGKDNPSQNTSDPADEFVGNYTYTETYTEKWGLDNSEGTGNGSFTITKTGTNGVKIEGDFNSKTGIVAAGLLNFVDYKADDDIFETSYYFGAAQFSGKELKFTYRRSGKAIKDGLPWTYEKVGKVTARKK